MQSSTSSNSQRAEPAHDILRQVRRHPLDPMFSPKTVAVIGATENKGSVGRTVFQNMGRGGFEGTVYPVNPKRSSVLCVKAYPTIGVGAREGGSGGDHHPGRHGAGVDQRMRGRRGPRGGDYFGRIQGDRACRR